MACRQVLAGFVRCGRQNSYNVPCDTRTVRKFPILHNYLHSFTPILNVECLACRLYPFSLWRLWLTNLFLFFRVLHCSRSEFACFFLYSCIFYLLILKVMVNLDPTDKDHPVLPNLHSMHSATGCKCVDQRFSNMRINHYLGCRGDYVDRLSRYWTVSQSTSYFNVCVIWCSFLQES